MGSFAPFVGFTEFVIIMRCENIWQGKRSPFVGKSNSFLFHRCPLWMEPSSKLTMLLIGETNLKLKLRSPMEASVQFVFRGSVSKASWLKEHEKLYSTLDTLFFREGGEWRRWYYESNAAARISQIFILNVLVSTTIIEVSFYNITRLSWHKAQHVIFKNCGGLFCSRLIQPNRTFTNSQLIESRWRGRFRII